MTVSVCVCESGRIVYVMLWAGDVLELLGHTGACLGVMDVPRLGEFTAHLGETHLKHRTQVEILSEPLTASFWLS